MVMAVHAPCMGFQVFCYPRSRLTTKDILACYLMAHGCVHAHPTHLLTCCLSALALLNGSNPIASTIAAASHDSKVLLFARTLALERAWH